MQDLKLYEEIRRQLSGKALENFERMCEDERELDPEAIREGAEIRAELSGKELELFDAMWKNVECPDPKAVLTAVEMIARVEELRAERRRLESQQEELSERRWKVKREYKKKYGGDPYYDTLKCGFVIINSNDPEALLDIPPKELTAHLEKTPEDGE